HPRPSPDQVAGAHRRRALGGLADTGAARLERGRDPIRLPLPLERRTDRPDHLRRLLRRTRHAREADHAGRAQRLRVLAPALLLVHQHQIGLQLDDPLDLRVLRPADPLHPGDAGRWVDAELRAADQVGASPEIEDQFGEARTERDDTHGSSYSTSGPRQSSFSARHAAPCTHPPPGAPPAPLRPPAAPRPSPRTRSTKRMTRPPRKAGRSRLPTSTTPSVTARPEASSTTSSTPRRRISSTVRPPAKSSGHPHPSMCTTRPSSPAARSPTAARAPITPSWVPPSPSRWIPWSRASARASSCRTGSRWQRRPKAMTSGGTN